MRLRRLAAAIGILIVVSLLVAGCARATPTPVATTPAATPRAATPAPVATTPAPTPVAKPKPEGILRVGRSDWGEEGHDPLVTLQPSKNQMAMIFEWLVGTTSDGTALSPDTGIAYKWEQSQDGMAWTFYLRKGVSWDKGYGEVTAEDVKFSLNRINFTEGTKAVYAASLKAVIQEIQVADSYTIKILLKKPSLTLPWDLSPLQGNEGIVLPRKYIETVGDKEFAVNPIGSGPYRLVKHEPGLYFKYEARQDYWQWVPRFKEVYLFKLPEEGTRIAMLKRGELDVAELTIPRLKELEAAGFKIFENEGMDSLIGRILNQWEGYFASKKVRQAMNYAVNKQELLATLFEGRGQVLPGGGLPLAALGTRRFEPYPYDPERARQLLREAGYPTGFNIEIHALPKEPFPLLSQALAGYLSPIGIRAKVVPMELGPHVDAWRMGKMTNVLWPYTITKRLFLAATFQTSFHSTGLTTLMHSPEMDALVEALQKAKTGDEYVRLVGLIQEYSHENASEVFLIATGAFYAVSPKIPLQRWSVGGTRIREMGLIELVQRP